MKLIINLRNFFLVCIVVWAMHMLQGIYLAVTGNPVTELLCWVKILAPPLYFLFKTYTDTNKAECRHVCYVYFLVR